jgi:hypothetical protein
MKALFLDIDGVLNHLGTAARLPGHGTYGFDPENVAVFNHLMSKLDPYTLIVVSSTWRRLYTKAELQALFDTYDIRCQIFDYTETLDIRRGLEIQEWLDRHPDVSKFAILDDDADMEHLMSHLVKTDWKLGLTMQDIPSVLRGLGSENS